jgi:hypothetical protein
MKSKIALAVLAFLTISTFSFAQKGPFLQAGVKAGTNINKVEGKSFNEEFKFGYSLGAFAQVRLGDKWHVQPEVLWNQYNTKTATEFDQIYSGGNNSLKDVKLNYLSIPILLDYSPTKFFTLQAGPQFGILRNKEKSLVQNGKEAFKSGDFSMLGGVQLNIANFKVSGRYVVGLTNINDLGVQDKWKNQGWQLTLGMRII